MSTILFIDGGDAAARASYRDEGRGYWSAATPVILEKHGFLSLDCAEPATLERVALQRYAAVVVAALREEMWTAELIEALSRCGRPLFLEGPLPSRALALVPGVSDRGPVEPDGTIYVTDTDVRAAAERYGFPPSGRLGTGISRPITRRPDLDWDQFPQIDITEEQAAAWRQPGWSATRWQVDAPARVVAEWISPDGETRSPGLVQSGNVFATAFGLLGFIGQSHTAEPFQGQEYRNWPRSTGLETLLLGLLDLMHAAAGATRARVLPWPRGVRWAMNVRHDFDRPLTAAQVGVVLDTHRAAGTSATWYWRARHLTGLRTTLRRFLPQKPDPHGRYPLKSVGAPLEAIRPLRRSPGNQAIRQVARAQHHEVAIHTDLMWAGIEDEKEIIEAISGQRVAGSCAHGDPDCFRFQGAPNVLWAERQGLAYTELIEHAHFHPHRFAMLHPDGTIRLSQLLCLPHHESFDRSTTPGDVADAAILEAAERWMAVGGMLQVMNHPDQNTAELGELLARMPGDGRIDWTAGETADWWRRTHQAENLRLEGGSDGRWQVWSRMGVERVVVELLDPDGGVRRRSVDVEPGGRAPVSGALVAVS